MYGKHRCITAEDDVKILRLLNICQWWCRCPL